MALLLKNGYVVDGANNLEDRFDILIKGREIVAISDNLNQDNDAKVIDCEGLMIMPGVFDMHVHLRDPGQTYKEDIISGSKAAIAGGVTGLMCMPNTNPVIDTVEAVCDIIKRANENAVGVKIYPCFAITNNIKGDKLSNNGDYSAFKKAGAVAVSNDGMPVEDEIVTEKAMLLSEKTGLIIASHCEDLALSKIGKTRESENLITKREIDIAKRTGSSVHICHVSTREAVDYIREAKAQGVKVTCEAAPHHFSLTESVLSKDDGDYKMNPPLRTKDDVLAIIEGLRDNVIDCIASDHAPHSESEKGRLNTSLNGVVGLETILPVTLTTLYHGKNDLGIKLPLGEITKLLCSKPREILGISGGELKVSCPADITIVDLNQTFTVEKEKLSSKSHNTCFKGMALKGKVKYTIIDGEILYKGD